MSEGVHGFAIVGCGVVAPFHARAIAELPNARLAAVCDLDAEKAENLAAEFGAESCLELDRVLERPDVQVVSVCVPSGLHAAVGVRAAEAGKHLLIEKPIEVSLEAADRLIDAVRANRVLGAVVSQHRFDP